MIKMLHLSQKKNKTYKVKGRNYCLALFKVKLGVIHFAEMNFSNKSPTLFKRGPIMGVECVGNSPILGDSASYGGPQTVKISQF